MVIIVNINVGDDGIGAEDAEKLAAIASTVQSVFAAKVSKKCHEREKALGSKVHMSNQTEPFDSHCIEKTVSDATSFINQRPRR